MSVAARLNGADKRTHDLAIHLRRDCVNVNVPASQKFASVIDVVDACWFKVYLLKSCGGELDAIVLFF